MNTFVNIKRGIIAVVAVSLAGCTGTETPSAQTSEIIDVSPLLAYLLVTKKNPDGTLTVCTYYNVAGPDGTYEPRGCQTLPVQ